MALEICYVPNRPSRVLLVKVNCQLVVMGVAIELANDRAFVSEISSQ